MITIKQMTYFLSVCKNQNLSRSTLELYVSQPTLSVTIKELEEETSAQLFTRKGSRLSLTEAGRRLRDEMKKVMDQYDRMNSMINSGVLTREHPAFRANEDGSRRREPSPLVSALSPNGFIYFFTI